MYGSAGRAVYLPPDMREPTATVFWWPSAQGHPARRTVPLGGKPELPDPIGCGLDTGAFEVPADVRDG